MESRQRFFKYGRVVLAVLLSLVALSGCSDATLRDSLTQDQANEIVAELVQRGVHASVERETGGRGRYRVSVKRENYSAAVSILHELKLPSEPRTTFAELIAPRGLMPDSREIEALRLDRALAADVEEALQNNPAIASARVIVRFNSINRDSLDQGSRGAAAAVIRLRPGAKVNEAAIRTIMAQTLPGVEAEQITLELNEAGVQVVGPLSVEGLDRSVSGDVRRVPLTDFLWLWRVPQDEYNSFAALFLLGILSVFLLGATVGSLFASARHTGKQAEGASDRRRALPSRTEKPRKELPEAPSSGEG